ncbi:putative podospora anserina S mat+ genomic DNA chromosome supercontig 6 [Rosellinia necatrix]|uniref:Putative podospora anserina S mat+ genomic DNA chromosome supercontig 6 n=1 Tax=Rosellinia necatrix TaxID=77044 RepID=A0A1W2TU75_ROSNE|nr:putative podospora anserina S mat+ genomic DNA chromosome supercontig 6 [Rosellinia necatrix]
MSGAELPLAIIGTVDLVFKYGEKLMKLCAAFRDADGEVAERVLRVHAGWLKTAEQLKFMQHVEWLMDAGHRDINERTIEILHSKLKAVTSKLKRVLKMPDKEGGPASIEGSNERPRPKRWKYALFKESIDEAVEELERWQRTADPSWYLILKIASSQIDNALVQGDRKMITSFPATRTIRAGLRDISSDESSGVFLPSGELDKMVITDIPLCEAKMATRISARKGPLNFLLTQMECPPEARVPFIRRDLRDLARKLPHDDPRTFCLLSCKGIVEKVDDTIPGMPARITFTMVFRTPSQLSDPRSLRDRLVSGAEGLELSDKFEIAQQMATSISYVHTFGFVHKNIRPETMITFADPQRSSSPAVFLIGFDNFRKDEGNTYRIGDDDWEKNLYRHPSRQGSSPNDYYVMQHDIYSLGVCLLEVGLGKSFVSYDTDGGRPSPSTALGLQDSHPELLDRVTLKNHLVSLARGALRRYMGRRYAAVVETCLTCLDRDNTDFGDEKEFLDNDGVLVGVRYIEKVLSQLNAICV